jgi:hypothetical protein
MGHQDMLADYNHLNSQAAKVLKEKARREVPALAGRDPSRWATPPARPLKEEREKLDPPRPQDLGIVLLGAHGAHGAHRGADRAMYNARASFDYV